MRIQINVTRRPTPSVAIRQIILFAVLITRATLAWAQNEAGVYFTVPEGQAVQVRSGRDEIQWRVGGTLFEEGPCIEGASFPVLIGTPSQVQSLSRRRGSGVRSLGTVGGYMQVCPEQCAAPSRARQYADNSINITNGYHDEVQIELLLGQFETNYPTLAKRLSIGSTHGGRPIWALKISDHVEQEETEPRVVIDAGIHAREYPGPEVALDLIWNLLSSYSNNATIAAWVNDLEIYVIPCLNPDGRYACNHINSFWRKNGRDNNGSGTLTYPGDGVDLNRNSSFFWGSDEEGSSSSPSDNDYRGPSPASEPEIQAYDALLQRTRPAFTLSLHSYWGLYYGPYGDFNVAMPVPDPFRSLGDKLASVSTNETNSVYTFVSGSNFEYTVNGDRVDSNYGLYGIHAYGVELGSDYTGFQPAYTTTCDRIVPGIRLGWQRFLAAAHTNSPKWRGFSRDEHGGTPVPARIRSLDMTRPNDEHWETRSDGWFECPVGEAGAHRFSIAPIGQEELTVTQLVELAQTATEGAVAFAYRPILTDVSTTGRITWTNQFSQGIALVETTDDPTAPWLPALALFSVGRTGNAELLSIETTTFVRIQTFMHTATDTNMVLIPAGSFQMGSDVPGETPERLIALDGFAMDRGEITHSHWSGVRAWALSNGYQIVAGTATDATHPVVNITWHDAVKWCNARSQRAGLLPAYYTSEEWTQIYQTGLVDITSGCVRRDANGYRLPTEAEWEKAARGGFTGVAFPQGHVMEGRFANFLNSGDPYDNGTTPARYYNGSQIPAGTNGANGYGLYDMAGNAGEWCWDWAGTYTEPVSFNPHGPASGTERIVRGGTWNSPAENLRCAWRGHLNPATSNATIGLRCVRNR